jgi:hypothetical protein
MRALGTGIWYLHWVAAAATPIWWILGSSITGGGWFTLGLMLVSPVVFLLAIVGPVLGVTSRSLRSARAVPPGYSISILVTWLAGILFPLAVEAVGDSASRPSVFETAGMPPAADDALVAVLPLVYVLGQVVAIVLLIVQLRWVREHWAEERYVPIALAAPASSGE